MVLYAAFTFLATVADPTGAAWHLEGWRERAVIEIREPRGGQVDTAAVRVLCQGQGQPEGEDYRVLDAAGTPVPFMLMFHDAGRYSLIAFRAGDTASSYYVYYGNPQAARAPEQVMAPDAPGAGPPQAEWTPRHGLVYSTCRRPEGANPKTVDELAAMLAASPAKDGARYQRAIADGYNPFGSSDHYLSIYRGWIEIPSAGRYRFCTASNEASFSFLDGKELIHWPGRHTAERGMHGEKNAQIELAAGQHYIEYYHEEVMLDQMAFLGWSPPHAAQGEFSAIAEDVFTAPHAAEVTRYETGAGAAVRFEPGIADTIWPESRHSGQYTRCRFRVLDAAPEGAVYRWDFGDGQAAEGAQTEHLYLAVGAYTVALTAQGPAGERRAAWPLEIYEVQHVTDQIHEGDLQHYVKLAQGYDRTKLEEQGLAELAHLLAEAGHPAAALETGREFVARYSQAAPQRLAEVRRLMAESAIQLGEGSLEEAVSNYLASLSESAGPAERFEVLTRLMRLVGIERGQVERAGEIHAQAESLAQSVRLDEAGLAGWRDSIIAAGDVQLWHGNVDQARQQYRRAEALAARPIASQVRAAQIGAYPNLIAELIASGDYGAALDVVDRWETSFPTGKLEGQTFFWRGKLHALRGQHREAARLLARSVGLAVGAVFETEGRWLLAQSLFELGKPDEAHRELARLSATGLADDYVRRARERLKQLGTAAQTDRNHESTKSIKDGRKER